MIKNGEYHYRECGLDSVFLGNGFEIRPHEDGRTTIHIQDVEGLHKAIGRILVEDKKRLRGKEIRFLRTELLMSQRALANVLGVDEQTLARWEKGRIRIPPSYDAVIRLIYLQQTGGNEQIIDLLRRIADLEDEIDNRLTMEDDNGWRMAVAA